MKIKIRINKKIKINNKYIINKVICKINKFKNK